MRSFFILDTSDLNSWILLNRNYSQRWRAHAQVGGEYMLGWVEKNKYKKAMQLGYSSFYKMGINMFSYFEVNTVS